MLLLHRFLLAHSHINGLLNSSPITSPFFRLACYMTWRFVCYMGSYKQDPLGSYHVNTINAWLDLTATDYPNSRCFAQQTSKVGVLRNNNTNRWWFVQFPHAMCVGTRTGAAATRRAAGRVERIKAATGGVGWPGDWALCRKFGKGGFAKLPARHLIQDGGSTWFWMGLRMWYMLVSQIWFRMGLKIWQWW